MSMQLLTLLADVSWKSALVALAVALLLRLARVRDPRLLHLAWSSVLAGMLALPLLSLWAPALPLSPPAVLASLPADARLVPRGVRALAEAPELTRAIEAWTASPADPAGRESSAVAPSPAAAGLAATGHPRQWSWAAIPRQWPWAAIPRQWPWAALAAALYLIGVVVTSARLGGAWLLTRRLVAGRQALAEEEWRSVGEEVLGRRRRRVSVALHAAVAAPLSTGWRRPIVLLPWRWSEWDAVTRRYALAHELIHVRRGDFAVQLVAAVNRCVFWFHPLAWMLSRRLATLAERACDQAVVARCGERRRYARVLLRVASTMTTTGPRQPAWLAVAMSDGSQLGARIEAVLAAGDRARRRRLAACGLVGLIAAGVATAAALGPEILDPRQAVAGDVGTAPPSASPRPLVETAEPTPAPRPRARRGLAAFDSSPEPRAPAESGFLEPVPVGTAAHVADLTGASGSDPVWGSQPWANGRPAVLVDPAREGEGFRARASGDGPDGLAVRDGCPPGKLVMLWFDDQNRTASRRAWVSGPSKQWLGDAERWIREDLCPSDRVAILSFKGRLRIHQDFTADRDQAAAALAEATKWKGLRAAALPAEGEPSLLRGLPPRRQLARRSREVVGALKLIAEAASRIEGRKELIVLTKGLAGWNDRFITESGVGFDARRIPRNHAVLLRASDVRVHVLYTGTSATVALGEWWLIDETGGWVVGASRNRPSPLPGHNVLAGLKALGRAIDGAPRGG